MSKFIILILIIAAAEVYSKEYKKIIEPEDLTAVSGISNPQISPDGKWIAFEENKPLSLNVADSLDKDIWIVPADGSAKPRKFAFGKYQEKNPQWSPNGKYAAFLANRERRDAFQLYLLDMKGGEACKITNFDMGVINYKWLNDSETIAFTAKEVSPEKEDENVPKYNDAVVIGKTYKLTKLYELNVKSNKIKLITKNDENVISFDYSHKGDEIVLNLSDTPFEDDIVFHSRMLIMKRDGSSRKIIKGNDSGFDLGRCTKELYWSPDDKWIIYFIHAAGSYLPAILSTESYKPRLLTKDYKGTIWYMNWNPVNGDIIVSSQNGVQGIIGKLNKKTGNVKVLQKVGTPYCDMQTFSISADGEYIAFHAAEYNHPDDIWVMKNDGTSLKRLTDMNKFTSQWRLSSPEVVKWKSKDGLIIEGLLFKPVNYDKSKRYPTIVEIHGGPTWAWWNGWMASWLEWGQMLSNHGYAVLMPNPRGSNGYGFEFSRANFNDWGGGDFDDIMAGVDYLTERGIADSARLGIGGWSYGGYMSAWAVTQTKRFKAAVAGAAVTDLITMQRTCGRAENFNMFFGGSPVKRKNIYDAHSPVTFVNNVKTPTLILHGENDGVVPLTQSYEFYQALKDLNVTTEFVVYPREGHGIAEKSHQLDLMHRVMNWFDKYLK